MLSLRRRIQYGVMTGTFALLILFSSVVFFLSKQSMIRNFDTSLRNTAQLLSASIEVDRFEDDEDTGNNDHYSESEVQALDIELDIKKATEFNQENASAYYQLWDTRGNSLLRSPSLNGADLKQFSMPSEESEYINLTLPDNRKVRAIIFKFEPRVESKLKGQDIELDSKLVLILARQTGEITRNLNSLFMILVGATIGVAILSALIADLVIRLSLGPIHRLADQITYVSEDNLTIEFLPGEYPAELAPICKCLNDAFVRIATSFEREKQFNDNIAHELRTPLAGIQTSIEVSLLRERDPQGYKDVLKECLTIVHLMNKMINSLLTISRFDAGQIALEIKTLNLGEMIENAWNYFADISTGKSISFENNVPSDVFCKSDREHLGMILSNVLHNAVDYTPENGRIWTKLEQSKGIVSLLICNTGCELTNDDISHVFDFFWRKSVSRSETGMHCGIGLSVAQKIAQSLGIKININVENNQFILMLEFQI